MLILLLVLWALAFFGSFVAFYLVPPSDFGFTAGANRVLVFVAGQAIAVLLALICLGLRWSVDDAALKRWAALPSVAFALLVLGFGLLFFWATV